VSGSVGYGADPRVRPAEWLPWLAGVAVFFLLPEYLPLGARILTYILFALSLDLILGYAGIITLGHSAFLASALMSRASFPPSWRSPIRCYCCWPPAALPVRSVLSRGR